MQPWIIERIRQEQQEKRRRRQSRPEIRIIEDLPYAPPRQQPEQDEPKRGVVIIELDG